MAYSDPAPKKMTALKTALQRLVPIVFTEPGKRPLVEGSKFEFDHTGCISNPREVFRAAMEGRLTEEELDAVCMHKMACWKCNETFAALRLEFEREAICRARGCDSDPGQSEGHFVKVSESE